MLFALSISLTVHVILFFIGGTLLGMAILKNPDLLKQIARSPDKIIELTAKELQPTMSPPDLAKLAQEPEMPMLFIEVDPSLAVAEAPENTKFYSAQSTIASNPDTKIDSDLPKIDGKQTQVTRAFDAPRTKPSPSPLLPSPKPMAKVEPDPKKDVPQQRRDPNPRPDNSKISELKQKPADQTSPTAGDLDRKMETQSPPQMAVPEVPFIPRSRPPTLAEAKLREGNNRPPGEKMKQDGGVRNFSTDLSYSVKGTPLGDYDAKIVDAIRTKWFALLDQTSHAGDRKGHVSIEFRLYSNGAVRNVKTTEQDVGELLTYLCHSAIITPAPYEKWPEAVRSAIGQDYRDIKFTFFYN